MEQKTYWWRIVLIAVCVIILTGAYIGPCEYNFGKCIGGNSILVVRSLFHFSLSFLLVSPALFFVVDFVFKKWLRLSVVWFLFIVVLISIVPEYQGGWVGIGPEKESVSIWLSSLFVIVSLVKLVWDTRKLRQNRADSR